MRFAVAGLALLALCACGGGTTPGGTETPESTPSSHTAKTTDDEETCDMEDPGPVLVEQRVEQAQGEPLIRRVTRDGRFVEHSATEVDFVDGEFRQRAVEPAWREQFPVGPDGMAQLEDAVRSSGFMDLAAEHQPDGNVIGGYTVVWTACVDDRQHTVTVHGVPVTQVPAVEQVAAAFEAVLADAADAVSEPED